MNLDTTKSALKEAIERLDEEVAALSKKRAVQFASGRLRGALMTRARKPAELHREAMELADEADNVRRSGSHEEADKLLRRALESEKMAALSTSVEPSRSVLLRSAASLALELKQLRDAERLVASALCAEPPPVIADELRDIAD